MIIQQTSGTNNIHDGSGLNRRNLTNSEKIWFVRYFLNHIAGTEYFPNFLLNPEIIKSIIFLSNCWPVTQKLDRIKEFAIDEVRNQIRKINKYISSSHSANHFSSVFSVEDLENKSHDFYRLISICAIINNNLIAYISDASTIDTRGNILNIRSSTNILLTEEQLKRKIEKNIDRYIQDHRISNKLFSYFLKNMNSYKNDLEISNNSNDSAKVSVSKNYNSLVMLMLKLNNDIILHRKSELIYGVLNNDSYVWNLIDDMIDKKVKNMYNTNHTKVGLFKLLTKKIYYYRKVLIIFLSVVMISLLLLILN